MLLKTLVRNDIIYVLIRNVVKIYVIRKLQLKLKGKEVDLKMRKKVERFGNFIRNIRVNGENYLRQSDVAKLLDMSLSYYSEIENNHRRPFDYERMEKFSEIFDLTADQKARMYDLESIETGQIPADLDEIFFEEPGKYAVQLLREHKAGNIDEEFWKQAIREAEAAREKRERGDD